MKGMDTADSPATSCGDDCPVSATAALIEHKWATLIIRELITGKKRFSELERSLISISPKMLSMRLREFEKRQIVSRRVLPTIPPTTEYQLTPLGNELEAVIEAMAIFGRQLITTKPRNCSDG